MSLEPGTFFFFQLLLYLDTSKQKLESNWKLVPNTWKNTMHYKSFMTVTLSKIKASIVFFTE